MLTYIIYFVVFIILITVIVVAIKAINKGIEANKSNESFIKNQNHENKKSLDEKIHVESLSKEINKLNKLYSDGIIDSEEFKKAKDKILN